MGQVNYMTVVQCTFYYPFYRMSFYMYIYTMSCIHTCTYAYIHASSTYNVIIIWCTDAFVWYIFGYTKQ